MSGERVRAAILISGRGSNMAALIRAAADQGFPAQVALVVSDRAGAGGLALAAQAGIATAVFERRDFASKAAHEGAIHAALADARIELVCLAGFMRVLSPGFVARWGGRMLNIHPSLLPAFPGLDTHRRALAAGAKAHGCTVHVVSEAVDAGEIVAQARVRVLARDTPDTLAARVLEAEHKIYPAAVRGMAERRLKGRLPGVKPIVYTIHATNALIERALDAAWVERAARDPQWIEPDPDRPGVERRFRAIPEFGGRALRAACLETLAELRIVTVFFDRKARPFG